MSQKTSEQALSDTDVAAIRATIEPWTKACLERDWDTVLAMCTDDIVFLPPNEPIIAHGEKELGPFAQAIQHAPAIK